MSNIETALVYIFTDDGKKTFKGCGAFVEGGFVPTCRHVWRMATGREARSSVVIEFPKVKQTAPAQPVTAKLGHACVDGAPDLVLLAPSEVPLEAIPLQVAREPKFTAGPAAYALAALPSRKLRDLRIDGSISDHRSGPDDLQEFSKTGTANY